MLNAINISHVFVADQDKALDFYVGKLGLEVSNDQDLGFMRWLTVRVPGQPGRDILLEKPGPPAMDDAAVFLEFQNAHPEQVFPAVIVAHSACADLILLGGNDAMEKELAGMPAAIRSHFADGTHAQLGVDVGTVLLLKEAAVKKLQAIADGSLITITVKAVAISVRTTYNAIGFLPGTDQNAGTLLITAHLDHLGRGQPVNGDSIYNGADDDASGTAAVLELARVLSSGKRVRRALLFVCFGSEELGGYGSSWFEHHLPVPLSQVVAELNLEQVGLQDPKMPRGSLMVNGWERSDLGPILRQHGARLGPDPYPEMF